MSGFEQKLNQLKNDLETQAGRVYEQLVRAVDSAFDVDRTKAQDVVDADEMIDRVDVEIERASIPLLAMGETDAYRIRSVLTIVKVNNELERLADCSVNIAEVVLMPEFPLNSAPPTCRVMANSVIGMVRDAIRSLSELNVDLAKQVLRFDDTVDQFKKEIFLSAEKDVAAGRVEAAFAFRLRSITANLERVADHATNICEQVIYLESGKTVRHLPSGWTEPELPS